MESKDAHREELMLKYKERIIDGRALAEKIKADLKLRIEQR
jgi:hypothetical protein